MDQFANDALSIKYFMLPDVRRMLFQIGANGSDVKEPVN